MSGKGSMVLKIKSALKRTKILGGYAQTTRLKPGAIFDCINCDVDTLKSGTVFVNNN